ncbi:hypothetical protein N2E09_09490 [Leuconostoc citreum]|uniref:hypothetical protein n=1 Tax=Leuconostoc citreum TaxID=33964 RepID=UPI00200B97B2|nr:hypothetical protein [Leuconostoc citreum]MCK8606203.1 hypothetical protein [Leuconostoc citreum]
MEMLNDLQIQSVILNDNGKNKLLKKMINNLTSSIFLAPSQQEEKIIQKYKENTMLLQEWYCNRNGYEFRYHGSLPGLVAIHVGSSDDGIFEVTTKYQRVFLAWSDIYDVELVNS